MHWQEGHQLLEMRTAPSFTFISDSSSALYAMHRFGRAFIVGLHIVGDVITVGLFFFFSIAHHCGRAFIWRKLPRELKMRFLFAVARVLDLPRIMYSALGFEKEVKHNSAMYKIENIVNITLSNVGIVGAFL